MQLRALIELSGYCETRNSFCTGRCIKYLYSVPGNKFFRVFCPALAGQNTRMKDNERNSEYGLNFFVSAFTLPDTETFDSGFIDVNHGALPLVNDYKKLCQSAECLDINIL